jgi:hypothetical protein
MAMRLFKLVLNWVAAYRKESEKNKFIEIHYSMFSVSHSLVSGFPNRLLAN